LKQSASDRRTSAGSEERADCGQSATVSLASLAADGLNVALRNLDSFDSSSFCRFLCRSSPPPPAHTHTHTHTDSVVYSLPPGSHVHCVHVQYQQVSVQPSLAAVSVTLLAFAAGRRCCGAVAAGRRPPCRNRSISPARRACSSKPDACR